MTADTCEVTKPDRCPKCAGYVTESIVHAPLEETFISRRCLNCGWRSHPAGRAMS